MAKRNGIVVIKNRSCDKRGRIYLTPRVIAMFGKIYDISVDKDRIILYPSREEK